MKLPNLPIKQVGIVALGVFVAGIAMNALRSNEFVNKAISGYDK